MDERSRVGVVDKTAAVLDALELGPLSLAELVAVTGLPRPTAHRLAAALAEHGLVDRDPAGRFGIGRRIRELAAAAAGDDLAVLARPFLVDLRDTLGESAQLYVRRGDERVCVAGADRSQGLRDTVPVGARLTMSAGSAAQVLAAWGEPGPSSFSARVLAGVRSRGYAHSVGEREAGVASVSAPVRGPGGGVRAALSVSGPVERLGRGTGERLGPVLVAAADRLSAAMTARTGA